jgi:HEAT repeat protein
MVRAAALILLVAMMVVFAAADASSQTFPIGIIDFYGVRTVSVERARSVLTFAEGDSISFAGDEPPAFIAESEARLVTVPGIEKALLNAVCCDQGRAIIYVGIQERGSDVVSFRPAPAGNERLAADIVKAGDEFSQAFVPAVERGDIVEDRSQGHALNHDPAVRAVQDRFIVYAKRDLPALRQVLRNSSNAPERALAAQVLGYAPDKSAVVDDLVYGMSDSAEEVRNNAMRALLVIAEMTERKAPPIPATPFIALLNSPVWTDRNKASGALQSLTRHRNAELLATLKRDAMDPLVEIARWKSEGHAMPGFLVLARIAGYSDDAAHDLWKRGERETVIQAAAKPGK